MPLRAAQALLAISMTVLIGCDRAQRFPPAANAGPGKPPASTRDEPQVVVLPHYGWREPEPRLDIPIQFVAATTNLKVWDTLKDYWAETPAPAGTRTAAVGLPPFEAAAALATHLRFESIRIKVPRGLPDPTPYIPAANKPTLGKWALGRQLFFDERLLRLSPNLTRSCADCHVPETAFTLNAAIPESGKRNVPSLYNSVYNKSQFWDGRADALEQVLLRRLEDEAAPKGDIRPEQSPGHLHVWPGMVTWLGGRDEYVSRFMAVFGTDPTADNVAKALATYMRTLLSGDSLFDRAVYRQTQRGGASLEAGDFEALLSDSAMKQLATASPPVKVEQQLARGNELFFGKGRCHVCHPSPLFTDQSFHNLGIGESAIFCKPGEEPGRFAVLPFGLKDQAMIGAFKTPSLRNVSLTGPYMHDGSIKSLTQVLRRYNEGLGSAELPERIGPAQRLIYGSEQPGRLHLGAADLEALELFLLALRGEPLPLFVTTRPKK